VNFTRGSKKGDLARLGTLVESAEEGVLFLMFMPGAAAVLKDVLALQAARPELIVRGVVSDLPKGRADEKTGTSTELTVTVVSGPANKNTTTTIDVVQPEGRRHTAGIWAVETTRQQFKSGIGYAIVHSKILVIDPFSKTPGKPIVVTGSHNFSTAASTSNDENFIVIRGDRALAEAYAVNIDSAWRHYASRLAPPHPDLRGIDYLRALLADRRREEAFWHLGPE
jgi:phosphatidylserine/phosphatidylglycerophosphate/cardiolipin synthase-like enzyme